MASTTLPPRSQAPGNRAAPTLAPGGGRQRRWSLALVALLVTLGSALAFVVLWMNAGGREPVLALRNDVVAGQVITDDDLIVVRVAADGGVPLVSSSARDQVVGRPAATTILAGTLLVPEAVGDAEGLTAGKAVIAIPVPTAEVPADDLRPGSQVVLYRTSSAAAGGEQAAQATTLGEGTVAAVSGEDDASSDVRVSVTVDKGLVAAIANAVAQDQIYVVQTAGD